MDNPYGKHLSANNNPYGKHLAAPQATPVVENAPEPNQLDYQDSWRDNDFVAGAYNAAASVPFAEKAAAGVNSLKALLTDEDVKDRYNNTRDQQKALNNSFDKNHNTASNVGYIGGAVANPANWVLGRAGLVGNSALQAGSDTDFSKEGAGLEFTEKAAKNLTLGKLLQKVGGKITGSDAAQQAGRYVGKRLSEGKIAEALQRGKELLDIGGNKAPLVLTAGGDAVNTALPIVKNVKINDKVNKGMDNVKSFIGEHDDEVLADSVDKLAKYGKMGRVVNGKYEIAKASEIPNLKQAVGKGVEPYIDSAQGLPGLIDNYGRNSGAVALSARKSIGQSDSVDNAVELTKQLDKGVNNLFKKPTEDFATVSNIRRQVKPLESAAKGATKKAEEAQLNEETRSQLAKVLLGVPKGIGSVVGTVTGLNALARTVSGKGSAKQQAKIAELLLENTTDDAAKVINRSRRSVTDKILQTNNRNAGKVEQYIPHAGIRLLNPGENKRTEATVRLTPEERERNKKRYQ